MKQTETYELNLLEPEDEFGVDALNQNTEKVDALLSGQLRMACGAYQGKGGNGSGNPSRLDFNFKPLLVIISCRSNSNYGQLPWIRGMERGFSRKDENQAYFVNLTWEDRAVQWYSTNGQVAQLDNTDYTYDYVAFGYAD